MNRTCVFNIELPRSTSTLRHNIQSIQHLLMLELHLVSAPLLALIITVTSHNVMSFNSFTVLKCMDLLFVLMQLILLFYW